MERICPHCGAPLPTGAAFCPFCAGSINHRRTLSPPGLPWRRVLRGAALLAVLAVVLLILFFLIRPRTYDALGEVTYTDSDGAYQLVLASPENRYQPITEWSWNAEQGVDYRFTTQLYINHADSGADAGQLFLRKVAAVTVDIHSDGPPGVLACSEPAPHNALPGAALVSLVDYNTDEDFAAQIVWTLHMTNGDTIRLRQNLTVSSIPTYHYYPEDAPMGTMEELQALVNQVAATVEEDARVYLHLPAVTYTGELVIDARPVDLCGTTEGDARTVFAGSIRLDVDTDSYMSIFRDIDFQGDGDSIAVSSAARIQMVNCTFTGWRTGLLGYGTAWVSAVGCTFEGNGVGLHFNSTDGVVTHVTYNDNIFRNNGTAVLLENVPTDVTLSFENSVFSGNDTDIDNRCGQAVDISQAIFQ